VTLKKGDPAPDFDLPSDDGSRVRLRDLRGKKVVLYFYPRDDTPGCTAQACDFRDARAEILERGAVVLGVSADSLSAHTKFRGKYELNFPLLSDEDHAVCDAYGVWKWKSLFGLNFWGIGRSTFLIDDGGRIAEAWYGVSPEGHLDKVLNALS
jgi:peroxiredoxin Q/BCP